MSNSRESIRWEESFTMLYKRLQGPSPVLVVLRDRGAVESPTHFRHPWTDHIDLYVSAYACPCDCQILLLTALRTLYSLYIHTCIWLNEEYARIRLGREPAMSYIQIPFTKILAGLA